MMAINTTTKISTQALIKWFVSIFIPIIVYFIPTNELYTQNMRLFLIISIFAILLIAFELLDYMIISLFLPTAFLVLNIAPANVIYSSWVGTLPWTVLGGFLFANVLSHTGILTRFSYWMLMRVGGSFNALCYGINLVCIIVVAVTAGTAGLVLVVMTYGICLALKQDKTVEAAMLMMSCGIGEVASRLFIYNPSRAAIMLNGVHTVLPEATLSYVDFFVYNAPWLIFCFIVQFVMMKVFKPRPIEGGLEYIKAEYIKLGKMTTEEKKAGIITIILFVFMLTTDIHGLPADLGFVFIPMLFFIPGINIGTTEDTKNINFSMILFICACMCIGSVAASIGFSSLISSIFAPLFSSLSSTWLIIAIWIFAFLLNFLLTPTAIAATVIAPLAQISVNLGLDPWTIIYGLYIGLDQVLFPYEYASYLILFSFGLVKMKHFIQIMSLKTIIAFIFTLVIIIPYWKIFGML